MGGGGGRGYRGPGVYFDFITDAFNMMKNNMGVYVVGALIALGITYAIQIPMSLLQNTLLYGSPLGTMRPERQFDVNWPMLPVLLIISLIPTAISQVLMLGLSLCALEEADTGSTSISTMFSGFRNFLPVAAATILYTIAIYVGTLFCIVPGIFLTGVLAFAPIICAKEGVGPIEGMKRSYYMLKSNAWMFFLYLLVAWIVSLAGAIACCVGVLFTFPIVHIGMALHYREFRGPLNQGFVAPTMTP